MGMSYSTLTASKRTALPQRLRAIPADQRAGRRIPAPPRVPGPVAGGTGQERQCLPRRGTRLRPGQRHSHDRLRQGRSEDRGDAPLPGGGRTSRALGGGGDRGGPGVPVGLGRDRETLPQRIPWFDYHGAERRAEHPARVDHQQRIHSGSDKIISGRVREGWHRAGRRAERGYRRRACRTPGPDCCSLLPPTVRDAGRWSGC